MEGSSLIQYTEETFFVVDALSLSLSLTTPLSFRWSMRHMFGKDGVCGNGGGGGFRGREKRGNRGEQVRGVQIEDIGRESGIFPLSFSFVTRKT